MSKPLAILCALALAFVSGEAKSLKSNEFETPSKDTRVVGGSVVTIQSAPFLVSIQATGGHYCAGTLIADNIGNLQWILTTAQCVVGLNADLLTIRYASDHYYEGTKEPVRVDRTVVHPEFAPKTMRNDIALIKLLVPLVAGSPATAPPQAAALPAQDSWVASAAVLNFVGWGYKKEGDTLYIGNRLTQNLRKISITQREYANCSAKYEQKGVNLAGDDVQFCAGELEGGKSFCQGDIGGALVKPFIGTPGIVEGIASFSLECGANDLPGVYTRVSAYRNWINEVTGVTTFEARLVEDASQIEDASQSED